MPELGTIMALIGANTNPLKSAIVDVTGCTPIPVTSAKHYVDLSGSSVTMSGGEPSISGTSNSYDVSIVECTAGDKFTINGVGGGQTRLWGFVSSTGSILSVALASSSGTNLVIQAPTNAAFLITHTNDGRTSYIGESSSASIAELTAELVNKAEKNWFIKKTITKTSMPNAGYIKSNGVYEAYASAMCSDYILITGYSKIDAYTRIANSGCAIAFYNATKQFMQSISVLGNDSTQLKHYTVDLTQASYADAVYARISCYNSASFDSFYCHFNALYDDIVDEKIRSCLYGKTINVLGDSVSSTDYTRPNWWELIASKKGATFNNYAISGTSIAQLEGTAQHGYCFAERYSSMTNDADMVVVMGGTNDVTAELGAWDSSDITTFYGALNTLMGGLIDKYPGKPIVFVTFMKRATDVITDVNPWTTLQAKVATDTANNQLRAEAIIHKCAQYGIPCVDIYNGSGINGLDDDNVYYRTSDELHPSEYGEKRIAGMIGNMLETLAEYL